MQQPSYIPNNLDRRIVYKNGKILNVPVIPQPKVPYDHLGDWKSAMKPEKAISVLKKKDAMERSKQYMTH